MVDWDSMCRRRHTAGLGGEAGVVVNGEKLKLVEVVNSCLLSNLVTF